LRIRAGAAAARETHQAHGDGAAFVDHKLDGRGDVGGRLTACRAQIFDLNDDGRGAETRIFRVRSSNALIAERV
jgi:hypothetical protein